MHTQHRSIAIAALAALVVVLTGAALAVHVNASPRAVLEWGSIFTFAFGAFTISYLKPNTGFTAPTAAQVSVSTLNTVVAQVAFADADTTGTITHNLGVSLADLALGFPRLTTYLTSGGTFPVTLAYAQTVNTITITKPSTAVGSAGTWVVIIDRPHSFVR
jgi:hypothetical protein